MASEAIPYIATLEQDFFILTAFTARSTTCDFESHYQWLCSICLRSILLMSYM